MQNDRNLVIDVHYVVDIALELAGVPTGRRHELETLLKIIHRPVILEGKTVQIHPVLSQHIVLTAQTVLNRTLEPSLTARLLKVVTTHIKGDHGIFDQTEENYKELARLCWTRFGTDAEDEAVLATAERHNAAIVTDDKDFRQYLGDRKVATYTLEELLSAVLISQ